MRVRLAKTLWLLPYLIGAYLLLLALLVVAAAWAHSWPHWFGG